MDRKTFTGRREEIADVARGRQGVTLRHVKGQTIGENPSGVHEGYRPVLQGFAVQLISHKPEGLEPETGNIEVNDILEISGLGLEVVRAEVHAFFPDDFR
jgi:hypothetical protein